MRALILLLFGLLHMTAALVGLTPVQGLAAATVASPAPKVFTVAKGLETFSTTFHLEWTDVEGREVSLQIDPEFYGKIRGPYNRRNVYGAILAFGPVLYSEEKGRPMFDATADYALCGDGPLLRELGIDRETIAGNVRVRFVPRVGLEMGGLPDMIEVPCS